MMGDDKVNMALDDIIKLNKRKRAGAQTGRNSARVKQMRGRTFAASRGRGGFAQRRGARSNVNQRRGARSENDQRLSDSANVSPLNNAATRRFVKNLVNKTLKRMRARAATAAVVVNRGAVRSDAAATRVSVRSRGIRKRFAETPRVVIRRPRIRRVIQRSLVDEEPEPVVYQAVRYVKNDPEPVELVRRRQVKAEPVEMVRRRPVKALVRRGEEREARVVQNGRVQMLPVRRFVQQPPVSVARQGSRVIVQQPIRTRGGIGKRNFVYTNGSTRLSSRANVIYVNDELSSRVQPSFKSRVRFAKRRSNQAFVDYEDDDEEFEDYEDFPSSSTPQSNRRRRKGRGFSAQYDY